MRVVLLTAGTRGDTQPMVVLGRELMARGHDVVIGASPNTLEFAGRAGVTATPFGPDSQQVLESREGQQWLSSGDVKAFMAALSNITHESWGSATEQIIEVCRGTDVIVAGVLAEDAAACVGEAMDIPVASLHTAPFRANFAHPGIMVTTRALPGPLNMLTGKIFEAVWWRGYRNDVGVLRSRLGLRVTRRNTPARLATAGSLELQAYSPALVPGIHGRLARRPVVGFLLPDEAMRSSLGENGLDAELDAWLDRGEPPIYFGFGSMPITDPEATLGMVRQVAGRLGRRSLVSAGWGRLAEAEEGVAGSLGGELRCVSSSLDHERLLPRCATAVHHGGAGTIAASTRAGVPTVVCSLFADQPFYGSRLERLGVGAHLPFAQMDSARLEAALRRALQPDTVEASCHLGEQMRAEAPASPLAADLVASLVGQVGTAP
ncbi:MAG: glycosyltransferase [Acidimicrobiales bacterium]